MSSGSALGLVREIANNAGKVNSASRERARFIDDLVLRSHTAQSDLERIQKDTVSGNEKLSDTADKTQQILKEVESILAVLEQSVDGVGVLLDNVAEFETKFIAVQKITDRISNIAQQTRMLSFNAMIEAKHAGEAGHGFAIVATEVKALAYETSQFAGAITSVVDGLSSSVGSVKQHCTSLQSNLSTGAVSGQFSRDSMDQISITLGETAKSAIDRTDESFQSLMTFGELVENMSVFQKDTDAAISGSKKNLALASQLESLLSNDR